MRLSGFDYSRPMFHMVPPKRLPGRQALSAIVEQGRCEMNPTARTMVVKLLLPILERTDD